MIKHAQNRRADAISLEYAGILADIMAIIESNFIPQQDELELYVEDD